MSRAVTSGAVAATGGALDSGSGDGSGSGSGSGWFHWATVSIRAAEGSMASKRERRSPGISLGESRLSRKVDDRGTLPTQARASRLKKGSSSITPSSTPFKPTATPVPGLSSMVTTSFWRKRPRNRLEKATMLSACAVRALPLLLMETPSIHIRLKRRDGMPLSAVIRSSMRLAPGLLSAVSALSVLDSR